MSSSDFDVEIAREGRSFPLVQNFWTFIQTFCISESTCSRIWTMRKVSFNLSLIWFKMFYNENIT